MCLRGIKALEGKGSILDAADDGIAGNARGLGFSGLT
jgi:hypothetical protein